MDGQSCHSCWFLLIVSLLLRLFLCCHKTTTDQQFIDSFCIAFHTMTEMETLLQAPSSDELASSYPSDFLEKLVIESPRRRRLGRTNSITRIITNTTKSLGSSFSGHSSWNDSITDITLGSSLDSLQEDEFAAVAFIKDLDQAIVDETKRKSRIEDKIENIIDLARARYEGGSEIGALLSMRKLHRNRTRKAYLAAARYQLMELRQQIEAEMKKGRFHDLDIGMLRSKALEIMGKVKSAEEVPVPTNEDLSRELYQLTRFAEI